MDFFKNKKRNTIIIILALLLLLDLVMGLLSRHFAKALPDQTAAERWADEDDYAQVSLFFTEDQMVEPDGIKRLEYNLVKKMQEYGLVDVDDEEEKAGSKKIVDTVEIGKEGSNSEEEPAAEEEKVYDLCYSAQGITSFSFENKTCENITTFGVAGNFFLFHPLELVNGSYLDGDDIMKDKIVVDEDLAWELFGSSDIVGQCVSLGGVNHYVAGVVKRQEGRLNKAAGLSKSMVFMSYESLAKYGTILSGKTESREISEDGASMSFGGINCVEVVMPNPVDGIAERALKESAGVDDLYIRTVDNTNRFSFFSTMGVIGDFAKRSMWDKPIFYPYWENVARGWEDIISILTLIRAMSVVLIFIIVSVCVVYLYRNKTWTVRGIVNYLADKKYDFESKRQAKKAK